MKRAVLICAGAALVVSVLLSGWSGMSNPLQGFLDEQSARDHFAAGIPELIPMDSITDEYGRYSRTSIKDFDSVAASVAGVAQADAKQLKEFVLRFVVEEALDSIVLDNASKWELWKKTVAPKYISSKHLHEILSTKSFEDYGGATNPDGIGIILSDVGNVMPTLLRDGGSRSGEKMFTSLSIVGDEDQQIASVAGTVYYFVSDASMKDFYRSHVSDEFFQMFYADSDVFNDNKPQYIPVGFQLSYTLIKEKGLYRIKSFVNSFRVSLSQTEAPDSSTYVPEGRG